MVFQRHSAEPFGSRESTFKIYFVHLKNHNKTSYSKPLSTVCNAPKRINTLTFAARLSRFYADFRRQLVLSPLRSYLNFLYMFHWFGRYTSALFWFFFFKLKTGSVSALVKVNIQVQSNSRQSSGTSYHSAKSKRMNKGTYYLTHFKFWSGLLYDILKVKDILKNFLIPPNIPLSSYRIFN